MEERTREGALLRRTRTFTSPNATNASSAPGRRKDVLCVIAAIALAGMLALSVSAVVDVYQQYREASAAAADGAYHLKRLQALLEPELKHPSIPDAATISAAQRELAAAEHDFALTRNDLGRGAFSAASDTGIARGTLGAVAALATAADEACLAGLDLTGAALLIEPHLHADLFASGSSSAPAFTANELARVTADYEDAVRRLTVAVNNAQHADLSALPGGTLTSQQIAEISSGARRVATHRATARDG